MVIPVLGSIIAKMVSNSKRLQQPEYEKQEEELTWCSAIWIHIRIRLLFDVFEGNMNTFVRQTELLENNQYFGRIRSIF